MCVCVSRPRSHVFCGCFFVLFCVLLSLPFCHRLSHAQRSAVKVLRRMQYFVARRKFQVSEKEIQRRKDKFYGVKESKGGREREIKRGTDLE